MLPGPDGVTDDEPTEPPPHALAALLPAEDGRLRDFVRSLAVPGGDVDDVVQEAMARAWRSRDRWDPTRPVGAWLRKIALRAWLDLRERRGRGPVLLAEDVVDPRADAAAVRHDLQVALRRLSRIERDVLLRFHVSGQSLVEIAEDTAMPLNTVKSHLHRARRRLASEGGDPA